MEQFHDISAESHPNRQLPREILTVREPKSTQEMAASGKRQTPNDQHYQLVRFYGCND
jgi:hypothetical protein